MKPTDFTRHLTTYLGKYVPEQRNCRPNTICACRDVFRLLFLFGKKIRRISPDRLTFKVLDPEFIAAFLEWLRNERHCEAATINHRLIVIRAFFAYVQAEEPAFMMLCQRIRKIPFRKVPKSAIQYFSEDAVQALLARPGNETRKALRDMTLLSLMYDSAVRVQEALDLSLKNIRFEVPSTITVIGKGEKQRTIPIMKPTVSLVRDHVKALGYDSRNHGDSTLFCNSRGCKLTRVGVTYVLKKYTKLIQKDGHKVPERISPHILRHTRAMHLLRADVPLIYIRDFLGHVDIKTTQVYANTDFETKRMAIEKATIPLQIPAQASWERNGDIMEWLTRLCEK
ncbi:MAG: site-specific integrase [Planctomycetes bacterium]|nr:site-specific integrase [Planctomycetota bacterium]